MSRVSVEMQFDIGNKAYIIAEGMPLEVTVTGFGFYKTEKAFKRIYEVKPHPFHSGITMTENGLFADRESSERGCKDDLCRVVDSYEEKFCRQREKTKVVHINGKE